MTVAELLSRISSSELTEWIKFYEIEPFGMEIDMLGHAVTASTIANVNRSKGGKEYAPSDFMPKFEKEEEQTVEQQISFAAMYTVALGGKDLRDKKE